MQRNTWLLIGLTVVVLAFLAWQFRGHYYIWKMKQSGFVPLGLVNMKARILPLLYDQVGQLGQEADPEWAQTLAIAIQEVRYEIVAARVAQVQYYHVLPSLQPVDDTMLQAFLTCFEYCKEPNARGAMLTALHDLDFNMKAQFFCKAFDAEEYPRKMSLAAYANDLIRLAYGDDPESSYWKHVEPTQKDAQQAQMQQQLQDCLLPIVRKTWAEVQQQPEDQWPDWSYYFEEGLKLL